MQVTLHTSLELCLNSKVNTSGAVFGKPLPVLRVQTRMPMALQGTRLEERPPSFYSTQRNRNMQEIRAIRENFRFLK